MSQTDISVLLKIVKQLRTPRAKETSSNINIYSRSIRKFLLAKHDARIIVDKKFLDWLGYDCKIDFLVSLHKTFGSGYITQLVQDQDDVIVPRNDLMKLIEQREPPYGEIRSTISRVEELSKSEIVIEKMFRILQEYNN